MTRARRTRAAALFSALLAVAAPPSARAQESAPIRVDADTQVGSLRFRFLDRRSFDEDDLRARVALRGPGAFEFLPLVSSGPFPFSPLELQRDVARLRRFYARSGFPTPEIDYVVRHDTEKNRIHITFEIREGEPWRRGDLIAVDPDGTDPVEALPGDQAVDWTRLLGELYPRRGERIGELEANGLGNQASGWLRNRGYPFARVTAELATDTASRVADVTLHVDAGQRATIGYLVIEGEELLTERTIIRGLPFRNGDLYSAEQLARGEEGLFGIDLVRFATADPIEPPNPDSTVDITVRVDEHLPRVISGQVGYATESGLTGQTDWAHRNFQGGGRTLSVTLSARTGLLVVGEDVQRRYSASTSLKQPGFMGWRRSLVVTPGFEYRDDYRDRSFQVSTDGVIVQQWSSQRTASVSLGVSTRRVLDFRPSGSESIDLRDFFVQVDTLDPDVRSTVAGASISWGSVDNPIAPRTGYLVRGGLQLTGPSWSSTAQYGRIEASVSRFFETGTRTGIVLRAGGGRLFPYGRSIPATGADRGPALLRLRDALFTAGGRYDVRGWGEQQLGPKLPDARLQVTDGDTVVVARRYVPLGGMARAMASVELRLPLPGAGPDHSTHVFFDTGRIWTPDRRLRVAGAGEGDGPDAVGTGIEVGTPVGPVRLSLGYKLNPSPLDVRDPQQVLQAILAGNRPTDVGAESIRRFHLHLAIGQVY